MSERAEGTSAGCFAHGVDCVGVDPSAARVAHCRREDGKLGASMPKTLAAVQSSYIPWKGYFDLIRAVDEFVLFDQVQFTRRDWRNRNRIKTKDGVQWLTIPVHSKGHYHSAIEDITISEPGWNRLHWKTVAANYSKARHFETVGAELARLFDGATQSRLSEVNRWFLEGLCRLLDIDTPFTWSTDYELTAGKSERLLSLCRAAGATRYLSGPSAASYLDLELFARNGIEVAFMDYSSYPEHRQLFPPFDHHVSVVDLLLNEGPNAPSFLLPPRP
jgi:WbqC-like protein family